MAVVHIWIKTSRTGEWNKNFFCCSPSLLETFSRSPGQLTPHEYNHSDWRCPSQAVTLTYKKFLRATSLATLINLLPSYWSNSHVPLIASAALYKAAQCTVAGITTHVKYHCHYAGVASCTLYCRVLFCCTSLWKEISRAVENFKRLLIMQDYKCIYMALKNPNQK